MVMFIQLRRVLIHNLLRRLHRIRMLQSRRPLFTIRLLLLRRKATYLMLLLLRMLIQKQIFNSPFASGALVHGKAGRELLVRAYLDCVEHGDGEVLAVVADEVVGRLSLAHFVDGHFAGLAEGVVVEARFADGEGVPFGAVEVFVDVDYVEAFVLRRISVPVYEAGVWEGGGRYHP